jgi:phosphoglycolate phosphatase
MERPHAILFDVDGTLVETGGAGGESWRRAFLDLYGVDADVKLFTEVGETDPAVGRRTFEGLFGRPPDPAEMARLMAVRLGHICNAVAESAGYRVLPGVESTLKKLATEGYLLGLTTGNVEAAAFAKLHRGGLNRFFCFGGYGSDSADRGELTRVAIRRAERILGMAVDSCRVLVVGDTPRDVSAARAAGTTPVGVATGHYSKDDLHEAGARYVLATLEQPLPGVTHLPVSTLD